ncbi:MAG TPA: hypothetical protein VHG09_00700, partial [Longimicrobiales bacterium]|nr:hypothetical protein [Longimicrobiales bacterium]
RTWIFMGLGPGRASDGGGGFAGTLQLSAMRAPHQLTARFTGAVPLLHEGTTAHEISLLYSRTLTGRSGHLSVGSGVGVATHEPCTGSGPECNLQRRVAIPFAAEAMLRVLPVFGIGVHAFANISELGYMGGVTIGAQFGWLPR